MYYMIQFVDSIIDDLLALPTGRKGVGIYFYGDQIIDVLIVKVTFKHIIAHNGY